MAFFDSDQFIIEMEQRPALWDPRCNEYQNKLSKGRAWDKLCELFVPDYEDMDAAKQNKATLELQRRWKSLRDSFRRELAKSKKEKSGSVPETGRKEYMYFKQLSFLLPICEANKSQEDGGYLEAPIEDKSAEEEVVDQLSLPPPHLLPPIPSVRKRRTPAPEEQPIAQALTTGNVYGDFDPDKHFLLGLLFHFRSLSEDAKLEVQGKFLNVLKRHTPNSSAIAYQDDNEKVEEETTEDKSARTIKSTEPEEEPEGRVSGSVMSDDHNQEIRSDPLDVPRIEDVRDNKEHITSSSTPKTLNSDEDHRKRRRLLLTKSEMKREFSPILERRPNKRPASVIRDEYEDDLDLFFRSACVATRRLTRKLQNQVKRDVLGCIDKAEEQHEEEMSISSSVSCAAAAVYSDSE